MSALSAADRQAIVDVTIQYCWVLDGKAWDELAGVFTEDAVFERSDAPPLRGLPAVRDFIASVLAPLDRSQHLVTNHQVEPDGEGARSRCYFHAQHVREGLEGGAHFIVAGSYQDSWTRTPDGWRSRRRLFEVLWSEGNPAVLEG